VRASAESDGGAEGDDHEPDASHGSSC